MFFFLSKIFSFLLSPYTWIGVLLVLAWFNKKPLTTKRLIIITFIVYFLAGNSFIADECMRWWETPQTNVQQLKGPYDVAIVLGGGMVEIDKADQRLIFRKNTDRIMQAIALYKQGIIKRFLLSGGSGDLYQRDILEGDLLKKYLVQIGIPDSVIMVDSVSDNTHENAVVCSALLKQKFSNGKYLLITSSFHMRRSSGCFHKQGVQFDTYTTNKNTGPRLWNINHLIIPGIASILSYQILIHELTGYVSYKAMGYL